MALDSLEEFPSGAAGVHARWIQELELARTWSREWREHARDIWKQVSPDDDRPVKINHPSFNILAANTEILRGALIGQRPKPDVRRRHFLGDPVGRQAALVLERALEYHMDTAYPAAEAEMDAAVLDLLITGRAVMRVRYNPIIVKLEDGEERLQFERADWEHVYFDNFECSPARCWRDVRWVAFRHQMTRADVKRSFGPSKAAAIALGSFEDEADYRHDLMRHAEVWEIWDKEERKVLFISRGFADGPLATFDDTLNLQNFFPCPEPLRSIPRTTTLIPVPEYTLYEEQARELDELTVRISDLEEQVRLAGWYDVSMEGIADLLTSRGSKLMPATNWAAFSDRGGARGVVEWIPLDQVANALQLLYQQRSILLDTIYQVVGLSDIMRGSTDARETFGAQRLKQQNGALRLAPRRRRLDLFLRELMRLQAELIAEKFDPQILQLMTGVQIDQQMMLSLRIDALRSFSIDIESEDSAQLDDATAKQQAVEFFDAMGRMTASMGPLIQEGALPFEAFKQMMLFATRRFKAGREVEAALETMQEPQQQMSADDQAKLMKAQNDQQRLQLDAQQQQIDMQAMAQELQIKIAELGLDERELEGKMIVEVLKAVNDAEAKRDTARMKAVK